MENMIGLRIKKRRKELGITLTQIHDITGISTGILSAWERCEKAPSAPSLMKLANVLNCSVDWILFGEEHYYNSLKSETPDTLTTSLSKKEKDLLSFFSELNIEDQDEILDIIKMKLKRKSKQRKSSSSDVETNSGIA